MSNPVVSFGYRNIGVALVCDAGGYNLTGCMLFLAWAPGPILPGGIPSDQGERFPFPSGAIASNGLTATYPLLGNDFPQPGPGQVQLEVFNPSTGDYLTSPPTPVFIYARLGPPFVFVVQAAMAQAAQNIERNRIRRITERAIS